MLGFLGGWGSVKCVMADGFCTGLQRTRQALHGLVRVIASSEPAWNWPGGQAAGVELKMGPLSF